MSDLTTRISALEAYDQALQRNREGINESFGYLEQSWGMFASVYSGQAAEQFSAMFEASVMKMRECNEAMAAIQNELRERIELLRNLDAAHGGI